MKGNPMARRKYDWERDGIKMHWILYSLGGKTKSYENMREKHALHLDESKQGIPRVQSSALLLKT